jgi:SAM-dependent methyltransferase
MTTCAICQNYLNNKLFTAYEMLFGTRDPFEYIECAACGCLQIKEIPDNLEKYYPENYYAFKTKNPKKKPLRTFLRRQRSRYCLFGNNKLWPLRSGKYGSFSWLKKTKTSFDSAILDIGSGSGKLLNRMQRDGFQNLLGVDPFIKESLFYRNGVTVLKKDILELEGQFDLIMCHHSFEHMPQPLNVLKKFHDLAKPGKFVLIRIPVAACFAWRHYGVNWVALDAPRHLFLHTVKSIELLSEKAGLKVADIQFDSTENQFLHSELYLRNIPLKSRARYLDDTKDRLFSEKQIEEYRARAVELNEKMQGDQACFYLCRQ